MVIQRFALLRHIVETVVPHLRPQYALKNQCPECGHHQELDDSLLANRKTAIVSNIKCFECVCSEPPPFLRRLTIQGFDTEE
jgi:hypothetical protein